MEQAVQTGGQSVHRHLMLLVIYKGTYNPAKLHRKLGLTQEHSTSKNAWSNLAAV